MNDVLTPQMVADRLHLHKDTVLLWLRTGRLPGTKLGHRTWRVKEQDLDEFLTRERQEQAVESEASANS